MNQYEQPTAEDTRFQFEIIKGLGESVRQQTVAMVEIQRIQLDMVERLSRIEARDHTEAYARLEAKVTRLEEERIRREGATGILNAILKSPVIAWFAAAAVAVYVALFEKG